MHIKSAVAVAALALIAGGASAQSISFTPAETVEFTQLFDPDGGVFAAGSFTSGQKGVFVADTSDAFALTYLGQESAFSDGIRITVNGLELTEFNDVGDTIMGPMVAGTPLAFMFFGSEGSAVANGEISPVPNPSFVLLGRDMETEFGTFAYVVGYNDSASHDDWDDYVVGINPIPEPSTYALLLAGLGVVGFVARRRQAR